MSNRGAAIEQHYASVWGKPRGRLAWDRGPTHELPAGFEVLFFDRANDTSVHATCGMSTDTDADALELHLFTRRTEQPTPELVELLTMVAHYHRTGAHLGLGHTVNFGRPYLPGSTCGHGLISLPYLDGPRLEWMETPRVRFLWLFPITRAELAFKKARGLDALEERFETARVDYLDPRRASVV
jgi:hypothetical protein